jgi:hypothetical protein
MMVFIVAFAFFCAALIAIIRAVHLRCPYCGRFHADPEREFFCRRAHLGLTDYHEPDQPK